MAAEATARHWPASRPWWPVARRVLGLLFLALVLTLLVNLGMRIDWAEAFEALLALSLTKFAIAAALAAASHLLYASFDLIGRAQTRHGLPRLTVLRIGLISYACNLNLGTLVGGIALRYRLYARRGLRADAIVRVVGLSILTNWLGYLCAGSAVLLLAPPALPEGWPQIPLRAIGAISGAVVLGYVGMCALARRREWNIRGVLLRLPNGPVSLYQLAVSSINWMLMAGIIYTVLYPQIDYPSVLAVLLVAAVAGVITHLPGGIGVLEAVFVTLLSARAPVSQLLAALLAYRMLYYLTPLAVAGVLSLVESAGVRAQKAGGRVDTTARVE